MDSNGNYNGFEAGVRIQNRWGFSGEFDYTYSHEIDIQSYDNSCCVSNPWNLKYDKGSGSLDRRHIFSSNYIYKLPFFAKSNGLVHSVLGGWEAAGTGIWETGLPAVVTGAGGPLNNNGNSYDPVGLGGGYTVRPNVSGKMTYKKTMLHYFDTSKFSSVTPQWLGGPNMGFGTAGKDAIVGPGRVNFTTSLYKSFAITERAHFELRFESFNTFNHTEKNGINTSFSPQNNGSSVGTTLPGRQHVRPGHEHVGSTSDRAWRQVRVLTCNQLHNLGRGSLCCRAPFLLELICAQHRRGAKIELAIRLSITGGSSHPDLNPKGDMKAVAPIGLILALAALPATAQSRSVPQSEGAAEKQKALVLEQQGKLPEAEAAWRIYLKSHPGNPEPYAQLGLLEARQDRYQQAIPLYRKALELDPRVAAVRLNLGLALFKDGQLKEAIPEFTELLKSAPPGSPDAQRLTILLGMSHYGLAQYAEAVPYLKTAAANDPPNLPLRLSLAQSCLWSKQYPCVMDVYREILNLNAESAEADMLAGEALDEMKDNEGSTKMFRAAVAANPKEPNVHFGLGYLLWTQKQYAEAEQQFQAELANNPSHAESMLYLGDAELQLNNADQARPWLEKAVKLDPSLGLGDLDLGIIDSDAGRKDDALRELEIAAKLAPNDVDVHWRLARLYRTMGRPNDAKAEFDKASKLNKQADDTLYQKIANGRKRQPSSNNQAAPTGDSNSPAAPSTQPQ